MPKLSHFPPKYTHEDNGLFGEVHRVVCTDCGWPKGEAVTEWRTSAAAHAAYGAHVVAVAQARIAAREAATERRERERKQR